MDSQQDNRRIGDISVTLCSSLYGVEYWQLRNSELKINGYGQVTLQVTSHSAQPGRLSKLTQIYLVYFP